MVAHLALPLSLELSAVEFGFAEFRVAEIRAIELRSSKASNSKLPLKPCASNLFMVPSLMVGPRGCCAQVPQQPQAHRIRISPCPLHRQPLLQVDGRHGVVDGVGIGQVDAGHGTVGVQVALDFRPPVARPVLGGVLVVDVDPVAVADGQQDLLAVDAEVAEVGDR